MHSHLTIKYDFFSCWTSCVYFRLKLSRTSTVKRRCYIRRLPTHQSTLVENDRQIFDRLIDRPGVLLLDWFHLQQMTLQFLFILFFFINFISIPYHFDNSHMMCSRFWTERNLKKFCVIDSFELHKTCDCCDVLSRSIHLPTVNII